MATADGNETAPLSAYSLLCRDLLSREAVTDKVPPGAGRKRVPVDVVFTPFEILDVDDVRQVVTSSVVIAVSWTDPALSWNDTAGSYTGLPSVELPLADLWKPHVLFINGASDKRMLNTFWGDQAIVYPPGTVTTVSSPVLSFTCKMDLRVYPFDTQHCRMVLYVYSHVGVHATHVESDVIGAALVQEAFAVRAEWTLVNITVEQKMMNTLGDTYLEYTWIIKRKTTFFVISFIVPIVMTSYMNVLVFIIPAECGEKISYLVSIFVSNAVFVSFCTDEMPQGMDSTPLVMYLVLGIMAESGILIVINSILLRHFHRNQQPSNAEPGTVSTTLTCTPCTPSKRRLSASTVHPYDENIKGDDLGGEAKELRAPERSVKTADKMTAMDKGFFVFTFTLNTAFVISLLLTICQ